jgi:hypothetical protein
MKNKNNPHKSVINMKKEFLTFVLSETTLNQIRALPPDKQLKYFWAVADFGINGVEPNFTGIELAVWIPMRDLILYSKQKSENWLKKQRENGRKGGRPKTQNNPDGVWVNSETPNGNKNKNKNENSNENDLSGSIGPETESFKQAFELSELLLNLHRKEYPDFLSGKSEKDIKTKLNNWAKFIELLIRRDKKTFVNIRQVIEWVKTPSNFWFPNIISGKKLREKYETLWAQMLAESKNKPVQRIASDKVIDASSYFSEAV